MDYCRRGAGGGGGHLSGYSDLRDRERGFMVPERHLCVEHAVWLFFSSPTTSSVDLVIFACLKCRKFLIFLLFTKFRFREYLFFFISAIIMIILFFCFHLAEIKTS